MDFNDDDFLDFFGERDYDEFDDEEAPSYDGALPNQTLMDNLSLKSSN